MSNLSNSPTDGYIDVNSMEQAMFAEHELSEKDYSYSDKIDARRRLENKLEDLALARDLKEFNFDI